MAFHNLTGQQTDVAQQDLRTVRELIQEGCHLPRELAPLRRQPMATTTSRVTQHHSVSIGWVQGASVGSHTISKPSAAATARTAGCRGTGQVSQTRERAWGERRPAAGAGRAGAGPPPPAAPRATRPAR